MAVCARGARVIGQHWACTVAMTIKSLALVRVWVTFCRRRFSHCLLADVSPDSKSLVSCGFDKMLKFWEPEPQWF